MHLSGERGMTALIEIRHITKDYGDFRALDDVSLSIGPGVTGLLGPNGAGKSTLIKVLLGLVRITSGDGRLLNFQLGRQAREIRASVGYMPEDDCYLHGLSGVESVQFMAQLSGFERVEALRRAHEILDFCGAGQERYRTVETYSTGMRQKLRFAQAIVHDPPILILDEPTSGMDPEERELMLKRIGILARKHGKAVILCTHILPDVQTVSDHVIILAKGKVRRSEKLEVLSRPATPSVTVKVLGREEVFIHMLTQRGLKIETGQFGALTIHGRFEELAGHVWQAAGASQVTVQSLTPSKNSLEEIFLEAVRGQPAGEQPNGGA
jgi:ABC-2 type transport system ATP-binding protein